MKRAILKIIHLYQRLVSRFWQAINPHYGCRFYPSCSQYYYEAIEKYGTIKGLIKGLKRILRCHPFSRGGIDLC